MRTLIAGGTSNLARALRPVLAEFSEVVTAGREGCDIRLDLGDPTDAIRIPEGIDAVINTAAQFGGKTFEEVLGAEHVNVSGALKLCQACTKANVKHLTHVSSIFATLEPGSPFFSIYSLSKRHSEDVTRLHSTMFGLPLAIVRPGQMYGVGDTFRRHQPFLFTIADKAQKNEEILVYGSNDALRNFIHVEDVANVIARVVKLRIEGTYSCASPSNVSYSEIAQAAIAAFESRSTVRFLADKPDIPSNPFAADDSLYRLVDYSPRISISQGMRMEAVHRKG